ncbi:hypothetical protein E2C01_049807 [Portunus trituberculatus]|uniref:Uncharacterized protein n=1 Tax=Portunus trituberculatus TaxID=210409 RepID=A0A5B7GAG3_PORTR|nr:hypothetical protein [Portunus trituberculatus]
MEVDAYLTELYCSMLQALLLPLLLLVLLLLLPLDKDLFPLEMDVLLLETDLLMEMDLLPVKIYLLSLEIDLLLLETDRLLLDMDLLLLDILLLLLLLLVLLFLLPLDKDLLPLDMDVLLRETDLLMEMDLLPWVLEVSLVLGITNVSNFWSWRTELIVEATSLREVLKFVSSGIKVMLCCYLIKVGHINGQNRKEQHTRASSQCVLKLSLQAGQLLREPRIQGVALCGWNHLLHV